VKDKDKQRKETKKNAVNNSKAGQEKAESIENIVKN
jgi:hypothetical protein